MTAPARRATRRETVTDVDRLQALDDAVLLRQVANLLYDAGDPRAVPWPHPAILGKLRHDLRTLADVLTPTEGAPL
jgi:hypothetical protein